MEVSGSLSIAAAERKDWNGAKKRLNEKLPHDLVIEILSWLHIKHLWPLRCVSKSWLHLLTKNPKFAKLQFDRFMEINNNHPNPSIIGSLCRRKGENDSNLAIEPDFMSCDKAFLVEFPFYHPTNREYYELCGISNGLLCISSYDHDKEVYIWNPLTNDHITISCLPAPLINYPSCIRFGFGFGFVEDVNVYKVVRLCDETDFDEKLARLFDETDLDENFVELPDSGTQISVYSIGVDSTWRNVEVDIPHHLDLTCGVIPFVNGAFHWRTQRPGTIFWDLVVTFDLKEEVISEFLLPDGIQLLEIVELGGLLCAIDRRIDEEEFHIWVMKEYGVVSSWSKQYIIEKPEGYIHFYQLSPLGVTHNGGIILASACENFVLHNPETKTVKQIKGFQFTVISAYAFLGSFFLPTAIRQAGHNLLEEKSSRI